MSRVATTAAPIKDLQNFIDFSPVFIREKIAQLLFLHKKVRFPIHADGAKPNGGSGASDIDGTAATVAESEW